MLASNLRNVTRHVLRWMQFTVAGDQVWSLAMPSGLVRFHNPSSIACDLDELPTLLAAIQVTAEPYPNKTNPPCGALLENIPPIHRSRSAAQGGEGAQPTAHGFQIK